MGILAQDITPFLVPTPLIPTSKDVVAKFFQVSRSTLTSTNLCRLPGGSSVIQLRMYGSSNSNAGTSATVTVNISDNTGVISTGTVDVHANGATSATVQMSNLPNIQPVPITGDLTISAVYAETGTASTSGGPYTFIVEYVR